MNLLRFVVGRLQANCYVVGEDGDTEVMVVDPGDDGAAIGQQLTDRGLRPTTVFVTHSHLDHSGGVAALLEAFPEATFAMSRTDYEAIAPQAASSQSWYGKSVDVPRAPDRYLQQGDRVQVGGLSFEALHTPGHTPGSICLAGEGIVFTGDVLFQGSIGRSDFPGGDGPQLIRSIRQHLLTLPPETAVLSGHGAESTIEVESTKNPFLVATRQMLGYDPDDED